MRKLLVGLITVGLAFAQAPGSSKSEVLFETDSPRAVQVGSIGAVVAGTGSQTYFYWVVANYPIGNSVAAGPVRVQSVPDTLGGANTVTISWRASTGATTYDLLRTTTQVLPNGVAAIAVATGIAGITQIDNSNVLANYTLATTSVTNGGIRLDNQNFVRPTFVWSPATVGMILPTATVVPGLAGLLTQGSVPFVSAVPGVLTEDNPNFFWDNTNDNLGIGTNTPLADLDITKAVGDSHIILEGTSSSISMRDNAASDYLLLSAAGDFTIQEEGVAIRVSIEDSGAIGLGTGNNAPIGTVDILDRTAATGATLTQIGYDGANISAVSTRLEVREGTVQGAVDPFEVVGPAGASYLAVDVGGGVGVGLNTPTVEFSVLGDVLIQSAVDSVTGVQVLDNDGGVPVLNIDTVNERVGIGTAAPVVPLHFLLNNAATNSIIRLEQSGVGSPQMSFLLTGVRGYAIGIDNVDTNKFKIGRNETDLSGAFFTSNGTTLANGIGIENTDPTGTLDVLDRTAVTGATLMQVGWDGVNGSAVSSQLTVTAGTVQGAVNLQEWHNAGGVTIANVSEVGDVETSDVSILGTESLAFPADFSNGVWALAGEFAIVGTDAVYTFAGGGAGTVTQIVANQAVVAIGNRWYRLVYTIAAGPTITGETFTLTNAYGLVALPLVTTAGAHTYYFESAVAPANFVLDIAGATAGTFTITDASLMQIQGGDVVARGMVKLNAITFADLPAELDGSMVYCVDCTIASPCAAAGPGAVAKRMAAAWVCN